MTKAGKQSADFGNLEEDQGMAAISRKRRGSKIRHRRMIRRMTMRKEGTQPVDVGNIEEDKGTPSNLRRRTGERER